MTRIPDAYDYLVAAWKTACGQVGLAAGQVLDGPPGEYNQEGAAVGATVTDTRAEFAYQPEGLDGDGFSERAVIPCMIWSGWSGTATVTQLRDRVRTIYQQILDDLARDRSLGGAVVGAAVTGGEIDQVRSGRGALVTCEFRIAFTCL